VLLPCVTSLAAATLAKLKAWVALASLHLLLARVRLQKCPRKDYKEPCWQTKSPTKDYKRLQTSPIGSKKYKQQKEPDRQQKEPYRQQKEPYRQQKEPYRQQKEPYRQQKEPRYTCCSPGCASRTLRPQ